MKAVADGLFDAYVDTPPSAQNAVDAVPGWTTALPPELGASAGAMMLSLDPRVHWMLERIGGVEGAEVLELGPLEGGHTSTLHTAGAARIDAVEGNRLAFLRCLIFKELMGLTRARFHLGDFTRGLPEPRGGRWDLIMACGVLYHLSEPTVLLERLAALTDTLYIWTHVYDAAAFGPKDVRLDPFTGAVRTRRVGDAVVRMHERRYFGAQAASAFCGGPRDRHVWMEREGLMAALCALGFDRLEVAHETPDAPSGPALSVLARRSPA